MTLCLLCKSFPAASTASPLDISSRVAPGEQARRYCRCLLPFVYYRGLCLECVCVFGGAEVVFRGNEHFFSLSFGGGG